MSIAIERRSGQPRSVTRISVGGGPTKVGPYTVSGSSSARRDCAMPNAFIFR